VVALIRQKSDRIYQTCRILEDKIEVEAVLKRVEPDAKKGDPVKRDSDSTLRARNDVRASLVSRSTLVLESDSQIDNEGM
jgi:hypothetical protein